MSSSARRAGVCTRPYVLLQGRPLWSAAILRGRRPAMLAQANQVPQGVLQLLQ